MPGKQLAIDADLNAGLITEAEARQRRKDIQRSADFYGAMDGASKFVRGDAIAALIIVAINTIGGFIVGVVQLHLPIDVRSQRFTLLTVGEGIVTQVPALLISTATGIIVTRAANESRFRPRHHQAADARSRTRSLIAAIVLVALRLRRAGALVHAAAVRAAVLLLRRSPRASVARAKRRAARSRSSAPPRAAAAAPAKPAESVVPLLSYDPMELEIGFGLIPLVDVESGRRSARAHHADPPPLRARSRHRRAADPRARQPAAASPNAYVVKIYGLEVAQAEVMVSRLLAMNPGTATAPLDGIPTTEPAFGLPALWIPEAARAEAEMAGYTVIDPTSVIATHLTEIIKSHAPDLLGRQETSALLDNVKSALSGRRRRARPGHADVGEIQRVLQNLLRERIPIRNLI